MKDTKLKEDATIYNHSDTRSEKEKWSSLSWSERRQYFKDYYLKPVLIGVVIVAIFGYLFYTIFSPKPKTALSFAIISGGLSDDTVDNLNESLADYIGIDKEKERIFIDTSLSVVENAVDVSANGASEQKLTVYVMAGEYDILITTENIFTRYAKNGFFENLIEALPPDLFNQLSDKFLTLSVPAEDIDEIPYGISLKDSKRFQELNSYISDPVIAIFASGKNSDAAVDAIKWFTSTEE